MGRLVYVDLQADSDQIYAPRNSTHGVARADDAPQKSSTLLGNCASVCRLLARLFGALCSLVHFLPTHNPDLQPAPARVTEMLPTRTEAPFGLSQKVSVEPSASNCVLLSSVASIHTAGDSRTLPLLDICLLSTLRIRGGVNCSAITSAKEGTDTIIGSCMRHAPKCLRSSDPDSGGGKHVAKAVKAKLSASWVVATATPHHATGNHALLSGLITERNIQCVHSVNGMPMPVSARGTVVTDAVVLPDVSFIPGLTSNLVSVSQLSELDYRVGFGCGTCCIRNAANGKIIGKAHLRENGQYVLDYLKVPLDRRAL